MTTISYHPTLIFIIITSSALWQYATCQNIPVSIGIEPSIFKDGNIYVPMGTGVKFTASISDSKYNNSTMIYKWSTKSGVIASDSKADKIEYSFTAADDNFIRVDVTHQDSNNKTNGTGSSQTALVVKEALVVLDPVGKLFLEHGELLHVVLKYKGSPPFYYCYKFCQDSDILPCVCFNMYQASEKEISITHYLHEVGNYTLLFSIENVMNKEIKHYTIKINDIVRDQTLPFVPIISSILAVFILLIGVALHLHYRRTSYTETADFNFIRTAQEEEEWEEELSFIQRVRYLFFREDDDYSEHRHLIVPDPGGRR